MSQVHESSQYLCVLARLLSDYGTIDFGEKSIGGEALHVHGLEQGASHPKEHLFDGIAQSIELMMKNGCTPSPLLVGELMLVAVCSRLSRSANTKREKPARLFERFRELHESLGKNIGVISWKHRANMRRRRNRLELFLGYFFAGAPHLSVSLLRLIELEIMALSGDTANASLEESQWISWRILTERTLALNRNSRFTQAIIQMRETGCAGFSTTDEGIWHQAGKGSLPDVHVTASSHQGSGEDKETYRDLRGPFEELGAYTIPPDVARLVITDLALMSSPKPAARAVIASKIADGTLTIRFGQVERPARRRAHCLLVAALCDTLFHHHHTKGKVVPDIDALREMLVLALPLVIRVFAKQQFKAAIEIRRDGVFRTAKHYEEDLRAKNGSPHPDFNSPDTVKEFLMTKIPWMLEDSHVRSRGVVAPNMQGFDACFLLTVGADPQWASTLEPLVHVALRYEKGDRRELVILKRNTSPSRTDVSDMLPREVAHLMAKGFGVDTDEFEGQLSLKANWEGTILT